jgi:hypothetical protein
VALELELLEPLVVVAVPARHIDWKDENNNLKKKYLRHSVVWAPVVEEGHVVPEQEAAEISPQYYY